MSEHIRLSRQGAAARITLDAPARNALTITMQEEMLEALATLAGDPSVRVLVIDGANGAFCSGAALDGLKPRDGKSLGAFVAELMDEISNPLIRAIRAFPHPVMSVVTGPAVGAGASLALAADIVIAAEDAFFLFPFAPKLGLIPDMGATWTLNQRLGTARAMGLTLLGGRLPAAKAAEWGLIWEVVTRDRLGEVDAALCAELASGPPGMAEALRGMFAAAQSDTFERLLDLEARRQADHLDSPAFEEGRRAFLEKRAPDFHRGK